MRNSYPVDLDEGMDMAPDDDFDYGDEIPEQIGYYDEDDALGSSGQSPGTLAHNALMYQAQQKAYK